MRGSSAPAARRVCRCAAGRRSPPGRGCRGPPRSRRSCGRGPPRSRRSCGVRRGACRDSRGRQTGTVTFACARKFALHSTSIAAAYREAVLFSRGKAPKPLLVQLDGYEYPVPESHYVNGNRILPPFPSGLATAVFALGCFWARSGRSGSCPGVVDCGRLRRRDPALPDVRGHLHRADRARGVRAGRPRPGRGVVREAAVGLLGVARPDPGQPAGQRRRPAVPVGGPLRLRRAAGGRGGVAGRVPAAPVRRGLRSGSPPRSRRSAPSTTPRPTTSSTWRAISTATARTTRQGSPARSASSPRVTGPPSRPADRAPPASVPRR